MPSKNAPNNKIKSIVYYDPLRPKFETEYYLFNQSGQIQRIYQRIGDTNEIIRYNTSNCKISPNFYSRERLSVVDDLIDNNALAIESVKFRQGTAKVIKFDESGFELARAEIALT